MSAELTSQAWPDVESGESEVPKKRRRGRRGGRHNQRNAEQIKTEIDRQYKHEYSADELGTALIWARDPKEAEHALIRPDQQAYTASNNPGPARSEAKTTGATRNETLEAPDAAQTSQAAIEATAKPEAPIEASHESASETAQQHDWATLDHEPAPNLQRAFFWNTNTESTFQSEHEALPAIEQAGHASGSVMQKQPNQPSLDRAINPNFNSHQEHANNAPVAYDEASRADTSRHPKAAAVQSQQMTAQNFEQISTGSVPDQAATASEFFVQDEFNPLPASQSEASIDAAPPLEATGWPGFGGSPAESTHPTASALSPEQAPVDHALNSNELQTLAKSIQVDGVSVFEMFTANRIDEEGLRRIVDSYLRGNELRQTIAQEVVRQQMKFERDPQLRDTPIKVSDDVPSGAPNRIMQSTMNILDPDFAKVQTEKIGEMTQNAIEKSQEFFSESPNIGRYVSIGAIVIIYSLIVIVLLSH